MKTTVQQCSQHFRLVNPPAPHISKIRCLKKQLTASCEAAKQMRLLEAVQQAEEAAAHHDTRKLFCIIRSIAPKAPYKLIRLRGQNGTALTAPAECALLEAHFREVFQCSNQQTPLAVKPLACMPFSKDALAHAGLHPQSSRPWDASQYRDTLLGH